MKRILFIIFVIILFFNVKSIEAIYGDGCEQYGLMSYADGLGYCKCYSGYTFGTNILGQSYCVSYDSYCQDKFGYNSKYSYSTDSCVCKNDYFFEGNKCISGSQMCMNKYGLMTTYDSLSDTCECMSNYVFSQDILGGLFCESCYSKYGINSEYNYFTKKCECKDDYTLVDGSCVKKQNNVYFLLTELDSSEDKAVIVSAYDSKYYLVEYGIGCLSFDNYVGKLIVLNLGTDYSVNMWDKIVLPEHNQECNIIDVDTVDENFSLFQKEEQNSPGLIQWLNSSNSKVLDTTTYQNNIINNPNYNYIDSQRKLIMSISKQLSDRLKGKILLQVEDNGEGWYLNPTNSKRYYLGRPSDAFSIMRELGLGISEKDYNSFNGYAPSSLSGRILLRVEANGEAYYVNPDDLKMHFLGRPNDAFELMRKLGLGISNNDIYKIDIAE